MGVAVAAAGEFYGLYNIPVQLNINTFAANPFVCKMNFQRNPSFIDYIYTLADFTAGVKWGQLRFYSSCSPRSSSLSGTKAREAALKSTTSSAASATAIIARARRFSRKTPVSCIRYMAATGSIR